MAKQKKKRNKAYSGSDAKSVTPTIHRYQAVQRSRLGQWWYEHKKLYKPLLITVVVVAFVVWAITYLVLSLT